MTEHLIREAKGPLPPDWKPGMPLPVEYKQKCIKKLPDFEQLTYRETSHMMWRGIQKKYI